MNCMRRSQSVAPPTKRSSTLTGFVRIEASSTSSPKSALNSPSRKRSSSFGNNKDNGDKATRWLYAVLSRDTLRCFARRADYKMHHPPVCEIVLDLVPTVENPKPFSFDTECLFVRCRATCKAMTIRLHESGKINQWVTALYYQALAASAAMNLRQTPAKSNKSVSFTDVPEVSILPVAQEPIDKADLFYSKKDYAEFLQRWKEDVLDTKSAALVRICERCK